MNNFDSDSSRITIGHSLLARAPLNTEHPLYRSVALGAQVRLKEIAEREDVRHRGKRRVVSFHSLGAEDARVLAGLFPEFHLLDYGMSSPGHGLVAAIVNLANEWCISQAQRHSDSILHVGGTSVNHVLNGRKTVHIVGDLSDDLYVHKLHENTLNLVRSARGCTDVSGLMGKEVDLALLTDTLEGRVFSNCPASSLCQHEAQVAVFDGMTCVLGPRQAAAAMAQTGCSIAYGFFPYTPSMLVSDEGFLGNTDVYFQRRRHFGTDVFEFVQSDGKVIVDRYPAAVWAFWNTAHAFRTRWRGESVYFQYELLMNRSCVMFYRMTRLSKPPSTNVVSHALDLPQFEKLYCVSSWKLDSLASDVESPSSWKAVTFTAERRLVDRVYSFGMQLNQKDFTRFALRKQLKITNDRVVVAGTGVEWHAPLTPDQIDQLSVALFTRVFVDRYDAGTLSSELMSKMKQLASFGSASFLTKLRIVAGITLAGLWDNTIGPVDEAVRKMCDKIHALVNRGKPEAVIAISRAPSYVEFAGIRQTWHLRWPEFSDLDFGLWVPGLNRKLPGFACYLSSGARPMSDSDADDFVKAQLPGKSITVCTVDDGSALDSATAADTEVKREALRNLSRLNELDYEGDARHHDFSQPATRIPPLVGAKPDFEHDPDPIFTLNSVYEKIMAGNTLTDSRYDVGSNVYDPQDRNFSARYLKTGLTSDPVKNQRVYCSRIKALNVPKRQETLAELLSAASARNLDPPVVAKPQALETIVPEIWQNFKAKACRPDVEDLLARYRDDPVAMGKEAFQDWMSKAKSEAVVSRVSSTMAEFAKSVEEYNVGEYIAMNKADVKVPLSTKIQSERIEPQVIVYHDKVLSAGYSTVFRVLVKRFLSLLKPNIHINLRKDTEDISGFVNALHPYDLVDAGEKLTYLENDFSKYDKSQLELVFIYEKYVFEQLGMNQNFVDTWFLGHVDCKIRSLVHAFSLLVAWQRKSGDATTAFGNVILNASSVLYAYPMTDIYWMVFMGDDSIVCTKQVAQYDKAVTWLSEIFNLQAKTYMTEAPYFASNFVVINQAEHTAALLPDPVKRLERWSMDVSESDDTWEEKFISASDVCKYYRYQLYLKPLAKLVCQRYPSLELANSELMSNAIANLISTKSSFRRIWEEDITTILQ